MKSIQNQQLVLDLINSKEDKYKAGRSRIFSRHRAKRSGEERDEDKVVGMRVV